VDQTLPDPEYPLTSATNVETARPSVPAAVNLLQTSPALPSIDTLNKEGEGYFLSRLLNRDVLIYMHHDSIRTLTLSNNQYTYETDQVRALIDPAGFSLKDVEFSCPLREGMPVYICCGDEHYFEGSASILHLVASKNSCSGYSKNLSKLIAI